MQPQPKDNSADALPYVVACPFCGIGQVMLSRIFTPAGEQGEMRCLECGATGPQAPYDDARLRWNARYCTVNGIVHPPAWIRAKHDH